MSSEYPFELPSPNIYGIETEYSLDLVWKDGYIPNLVGVCHGENAEIPISPYDLDDDEIEFDEHIAAGLEQQGIGFTKLFYLTNGGRLYDDISGPEYCTPETTTAKEAVLRSFDGDRIMLDILANMHLRGVITSSQLNRKIVDHVGSSRGVHINTQIFAEAQTTKGNRAELVGVSAAASVAKAAVCGSGGLLVDQTGTTIYCHSPRLAITRSLAGGYSTKPLFRSLDNDDGAYLRMETISGDALNFPWPMRASMVLTSAVQGMFEMGLAGSLPSLEAASAVYSARNAGQHGYAGEVVIRDDGEISIVTTSQLLKSIVEIILVTDSNKQHLDHESRQVLGEVIDVLDAMEEDPFSVAPQVESMYRWAAMQKKMEITGQPLESETLCRFDYLWDKIGGGIAEGLRERRVAGWLGFGAHDTVRQATKRRKTPPKDTRATLRAAVIAADKNRSVNWSRVADGRDNMHYLDPLQTKFTERQQVSI